MHANPLISVVIPTYNNASLVVEAVESVLAQTYERSELIVVDDGSTDDTAERLARFGDRLRFIRQENHGVPTARNAGIRAGQGELVAFLDSDDLWLPRKLEVSVRPFLEDAELGVVYTDFRLWDMNTGKRYVYPVYRKSGWMARDIFRECRGVTTSTIVARRRYLDQAGLFDEAFIHAEDWDLFVRLAEVCRFQFVPEVLTVRRRHPTCLSITQHHLYPEYNVRVIRKSAARRPDLYGPLVNGALARAHFRFGVEHYRLMEMPEARRELVRSLGRRASLRALDYYVRSFLPKCLIRVLREMKERRTEAEW